jgi:uncharacterized protein (DUF2235 family)
MTKNIVVCCDGTSNEFSAARTNVAKLCYTLVQDSNQCVFYHPGLGTMEPPGALTGAAIKTTKFLGLAVGYGLTSDIRDAYVFLMNEFEPGDRVYLFGFSRGAYTARAVTSLLHMYGLVRAGNEPLVPYAIRMMCGVNNLPEHSGEHKPGPRKVAAAENIWSLANDFKKTFSTECKPHFVGLWDTVSSVGWISHPFRAPYTANNPDIQFARHALAIDEHRSFFQPSPWFPKGSTSDPHSGPKDLRQVWFPGDHSDVGGGYPESECGLSKCALKWMICEAAVQGLSFEPTRLARMFGAPGSPYVAPNPQGILHNSMTSFWPVCELLPKKVFDPQTKTWPWRINRFRRREIPPDALVHESAFERGPTYRRYFPATATMVRSVCDASLGI